MAKVGWAYDLKTVARETILKRVERTGDGSHNTWGWGDKDGKDAERRHVLVTHQKTN